MDRHTIKQQPSQQGIKTSKKSVAMPLPSTLDLSKRHQEDRFLNIKRMWRSGLSSKAFKSSGYTVGSAALNSIKSWISMKETERKQFQFLSVKRGEVLKGGIRRIRNFNDLL